MESDKTQNQLSETVVGVFENAEDARKAAAALKSSHLNVQRVSWGDQNSAGGMPEIVYDHIEEVEPADSTEGMLKGAAIGAVSGLVFLGVPGLNVAAPVIGGVAGAWIGAVAGFDESNRGTEIPSEEDYQRMLNDGKSVVIVAGDEKPRIEFAATMEKCGAVQVNQHPPVLHSIREPKCS